MRNKCTIKEFIKNIPKLHLPLDSFTVREIHKMQSVQPFLWNVSFERQFYGFCAFILLFDFIKYLAPLT